MIYIWNKSLSSPWYPGEDFDNNKIQSLYGRLRVVLPKRCRQDERRAVPVLKALWGQNWGISPFFECELQLWKPLKHPLQFQQSYRPWSWDLWGWESTYFIEFFRQQYLRNHKTCIWKAEKRVSYFEEDTTKKDTQERQKLQKDYKTISISYQEFSAKLQRCPLWFPEEVFFLRKAQELLDCWASEGEK